MDVEHLFSFTILTSNPQDDIALVVCMVILMSVTGGIVMFKVITGLISQKGLKVTPQLLLRDKNSQNKLLVISMMRSVLGHH